MKHSIHRQGLTYSLRPVTLIDSAAIVQLRNPTSERNCFINPISLDTKLQDEWLLSYFEREGDYYFAIVNNQTDETEGFIGIYNVNNAAAEWGRWILREGSLAASESVDLLYKIAFNDLNLNEIYSRTLESNKSVINFHDRLVGCRYQKIEKHVEINGIFYDAIEHRLSKVQFLKDVQPKLESQATRLLTRSMSATFKGLKLHHIGVACNEIEADFVTFRIMGYEREGLSFADPIQGIKGMFISHPTQPRIELLENLPSRGTLNRFLENHNKLYHLGFEVSNIDAALEALTAFRARILSPPQYSSYFNSNICFLVMSNRLIIELIESPGL